MTYLGIRASANLDRAVAKMAESTGKTKSEIIRESIENYVFHFLQSPQDQDWKPIAWSFLGIDSHKLNYALARAETAAEFFSYISKWTKHTIQIVPGKNVKIQIKTDEKTFSSTCNHDQPKIDTIKEVIMDLESQYTDYITESFEDGVF